MPFRLRKTKTFEAPGVVPPENEATKRVIETICSLELDPDQVLLIGSAALTLYGLTMNPYAGIPSDERPTQFDEETGEQYVIPPQPSSPENARLSRPNDVDLAVSEPYIIDAYNNVVLKTVSKVPQDVRSGHRGRRVLTLSTQPLRTDLIASGNGRAFKKAHEQGRIIEGTQGIRIASPSLLKSELEYRAANGGWGDPKARDDLNQIKSAERDGRWHF